MYVARYLGPWRWSASAGQQVDPTAAVIRSCFRLHTKQLTMRSDQRVRVNLQDELDGA